MNIPEISISLVARQWALVPNLEQHFINRISPEQSKKARLREVQPTGVHSTRLTVYYCLK